jgi:hypothetical protein
MMAEPTDSTAKFGDAQPGIERAKIIMNELASAAQSAVVSLVDEQKAGAAMRVGVLAQALRAAGRSFEQSDSPWAANYAHSAARQIEGVAETIRGRHWTEIAADLEEVARHRPVRFIAGSVLLGFLAGRLLTAPRHSECLHRDGSRAGEGAVTATVAGTEGEGGSAGRRLTPETPELP